MGVGERRGDKPRECVNFDRLRRGQRQLDRPCLLTEWRSKQNSNLLHSRLLWRTSPHNAAVCKTTPKKHCNPSHTRSSIDLASFQSVPWSQISPLYPTWKWFVVNGQKKLGSQRSDIHGERDQSFSMYRIDLLYLLSVCTLIMKYTTPAQNASTISTLNSVSLQPVNVSVLNNLEARFEILATSNQTLCLSQQPVRRICFSSGNLRNGDSDHCIVGLFLSWDTHNFESQPPVHWAVWTE